MVRLTVNAAGKAYGKQLIFEGINLTLEGGKIYGLLGYNGSGKTVFMKCLAGLELLSQGEIWLGDQMLGRDMEFLPSLGLIIETPSFIESFTGFENLKLLALINQKISDHEIKAMMRAVRLDPDLKKKVKHYSLGMKQKLALAQAMMESPAILLLDEPTNAIDRDSIQAIYDLLKDLRRQGSLILIASHLHGDLGALYDEVIDMEIYSRVER